MQLHSELFKYYLMSLKILFTIQTIVLSQTGLNNVIQIRNLIVILLNQFNGFIHQYDYNQMY